MPLAQPVLPPLPSSLEVLQPRSEAPAGIVTGPEPRLSIVIVNYRQWHETAALTRQILAFPPTHQGTVEVVIVDNHSPYHPITSSLRRRPGVSLRRWKQNRGFARAVNEGCRLSRGHWLLVLNPDVSLREGFLEGLLELTELLPVEDPRAGIVGFHLHNADGSLQRSAGSFPTLGGTLVRLLVPRPRRKYHSPPMDRASRVDWVTGCCLLVQRDCLDHLGGFDEDYFLYYEDVDFCRRAQGRGWTVWYEPGLHAVHHRPLHGRTVPTPLRLFTRHSLLVYCAKHWSPWQFRLLAKIVGLEAWCRRWWARGQGDRQKAAQFQELGVIAREMACGHHAAARRRLNRVVVRHEEESRPFSPAPRKKEGLTKRKWSKAHE